MTKTTTKTSKLTNVRAAAVSVLVKMLNNSGSLTGALHPFRERDDFPLLQEICFGTCRHFFSLEFILEELLSKPLRKKDKDVKCLLLVGLYQLKHMSLPEYAVINETVSAVGSFKKPWSRGLINGVLRNYLRDKEGLAITLAQSPASAKFDQPQWLLEEFKKDWPDHWQTIAENSNQRPPMTLRVNLSKTSRDAALDELHRHDISAVSGKLANSSVYLQSPIGVNALPGFGDGSMSIQDEASQLIPSILQLLPKQRVLDACSAPGGKACHILETELNLSAMSCIDVSESRLERVNENLERLSLTANVIAADARDTTAWWDGDQFDRILLDAPCSATGVIRRHPDIKLLRRPKDIEELHQLQLEMLESIWPTLKPDGLLLYTSCSILRKENDETLKIFIESTDNAKYEGITADWGVECRYGRQLLPSGPSGTDGFFFSLLRKSN
ncbi:MAG: 16S rRNA (cytosine(967)-C(5))-methyltransferase RsmB [Pseudohongiellaceae bacterium]